MTGQDGEKEVTFKYNAEKINYASFIIGLILTKLCEKSYIIVLPYLMYELTSSAFSMGSMFLFITLPYLIFSPISGVITDNYSSKSVIILTTLVMGVLILLIPIVDNQFSLREGFILIIAFLTSTMTSGFSIAQNTIMPKLFRKEKLMKINTFYQFIDTTCLLFGSALAGGLIGIFGSLKTLVIIGVTLILASIIFTMMKVIEVADLKDKKSNRNSLEQLFEGLKFIFENKLIRGLTILTLIVNVANGAIISMLIFFSKSELSLSSEQIGLIYSGSAITQIVGISLVPIISKNRDIIKLLIISLIFSATGIFIIGISWSWITLLIGVAVQSAPIIIFNVFNRYLKQVIVPTYLLGRVNGISMMISLFALPFSGFIMGVLVGFISIRIIFVTLSIANIVFILLFLISNKEQYFYKRE